MNLRSARIADVDPVVQMVPRSEQHAPLIGGGYAWRMVLHPEVNVHRARAVGRRNDSPAVVGRTLDGQSRMMLRQQVEHWLKRIVHFSKPCRRVTRGRVMASRSGTGQPSSSTDVRVSQS